MSEFKIPIYGGKVRLFTDPEQFEKVTETEINLNDCKGLVEVTHEQDITYNVGVFQGGLVTLVHELMHVTHMVIERAGFTPQCGNSEPACYLIDTLFRKAVSKINIGQPANFFEKDFTL